MTDISKVRKIKEIEGNYEGMTNKHLDAGWILINTYTFGAPGDRGSISERIVFVLGWPHSDRPPVEPGY
jgi:hypothetical protein